MNRRTFTLAGFFGAIGATIGKALGYDGTPPKPQVIIGLDTARPDIDTTVYSIKVGRQIHVMSDTGWDTYASTPQVMARLNETAEVKDEIDWERYESHKEFFIGSGTELTPPKLRERMTLAPEGIKSWSDAPDAWKPSSAFTFPAKVSMLNDLLGKLEALRQTPFEPDARELRGRIHDLEQEIRLAIQIRATMCDGHNGPSLLTQMTEMPDGRRLCDYCYKQETESDVQHSTS